MGAIDRAEIKVLYHFAKAAYNLLGLYYAASCGTLTPVEGRDSWL
jgi:hypothetical protein